MLNIGRKVGFTLIEVMVTMILVSLLLSFVGPYSISQIEKIQRKADSIQVKRWLMGRMYWSFISGNASTVEFSNSEVKHFTLNTTGEKMLLETKQFKSLRFPSQLLLINQYGVSTSSSFKTLMNDTEIQHEFYINE